MELYVLGFTATTKQDPQINEALMMYDMNLDTYKNLNPGEAGDGYQILVTSGEEERYGVDIITFYMNHFSRVQVLIRI